MKKFSILFVLLLLLFTSCASNHGGAETSGDPSTQESIQTSVCDPPPQPIYFESFDDMILFLKHPDLSSYSEEDKAAYRSMVDRFLESGYVMRVATQNPEISSLDRFFLYPRTAGEDSGVAYWYEYRGLSYQVILYHADKNVLNACKDEQLSIFQYLTMRRGSNLCVSESSNETIDFDHGPANIVRMLNGDLYIETFIECDIYVRVRAQSISGEEQPSQEDLLEFYSLIEFYKERF